MNKRLEAVLADYHKGAEKELTEEELANEGLIRAEFLPDALLEVIHEYANLDVNIDDIRIYIHPVVTVYIYETSLNYYPQFLSGLRPLALFTRLYLSELTKVYPYNKIKSPYISNPDLAMTLFNYYRTIEGQMYVVKERWGDIVMEDLCSKSENKGGD